MRFALYGQSNRTTAVVVIGALIVFFAIAVWGYDPQRGLVRRKG